MKFLDLLFSKNKRRWISFLNEVESPIDRFGVSKWRLIVDNFFLKHNIDYDKFYLNAKWDNDRLSIYQDKNDIHKCTPSFKKYFADSIERKLTNKQLGVNEWFYHAYPDVAYWFEEHYEEIERYCNSVGYYYSFDDEKYNLHVFEYVINEYLKKQGKLECTI